MTGTCHFLEKEGWRRYRVAIFVADSAGRRTLLYVGDAASFEDRDWLLIEGESTHAQARHIELESRCLTKQPPSEPGIEADWTFVVNLPSNANR